ncbi:hypothetical protein D9M73_130790 [compost metagenome]
MPASMTPQSATKTNMPRAKLATRRLIGVRMNRSAIGIMKSMMPNTVARIVGIHSFATDMVARPLEMTARLAMTLAALAGESSNSTSPTVLPSRICVSNACALCGRPSIIWPISPSCCLHRAICCAFCVS